MLWFRRAGGPERRDRHRSSVESSDALPEQPASDAEDIAGARRDTQAPAQDARAAGTADVGTPQPASPVKTGWGRRPWLDALAVLALVAAILYLHCRVVRVAFITSGSMIPTISPGDRVVLHLSAYRREPPRRGDVVALRSGAEGGCEVKRVIGVGGDELMVGWGMVFRNGEPLDEPYVHQVMFPEDPVRVTLGEGELFVMGDNRNGSEDSRDYGSVQESEALGRVCWRILPLGRAGAVR